MTTPPADSVPSLSPLERARPAAARFDRRPLRLLVAAGLIAGVVLRVFVYRSTIGALDGDEATWGLMAMHAAHGQFTAFFWAQPYGGTQETAVVGLLFWLFGVHLVLMRLVPMTLAAVSAFVLWRIGLRTVGRLPALAGALLLWVWPPFVLWKLEIWHGFYGSELLYALLIILLALRLDEAPTRRDIAILGLVLGLAFWESLQTVVVIVPALLWLSLRRPSLWRLAPLAVPGVVIGALPWLLSNLHHDWWSINHEPSQAFSYVGKLRIFADATFPMILGLRVPFSSQWLLTRIGSGLAYAAIIAALVLVAWRRRRTQLSLFPAILVVYPFLTALSGLAFLSTEPRYEVLAVPAVIVLLATFVTTPPRLAVALVLGVVVSVLYFDRWISWNDATRATDSHRLSIAPAIRALERAGIDRAYASYWLAYRITFTTRERLIVSEADMNHLRAVGPHRVMPPVPTNFTMHHHPAYDTAVRDAPRHAYLLVRGDFGTPHDLQLLLSHGYREVRLGQVLMLVSPPQ